MTKKERAYILHLISKYEKYSKEEELSYDASGMVDEEHYMQYRINLASADTLRNLLADLEGGI